MNKTALFIGLGIVLTSCNLFTDPVRKSAEAYLMENINDPSSYEFVSLVPTDTITYLDNIEAEIKVHQDLLSGYMMVVQARQDVLKRLKLLNHINVRDLIDVEEAKNLSTLKKVSDLSLIIASVDSTRKALGDRVNEVACYEFEFTYRAKNAMGGIILTRSTLQITPEYNVLAIASTIEDKIVRPNKFPGYLDLISK